MKQKRGKERKLIGNEKQINKMKKMSSEQQSGARDSERRTRENKEDEAVKETRGKERKLNKKKDK